MSLIVQNYNNSTTDEYGTLLTVDRQMGSGVVDGLLVAANATPNMTVYVQPGSGLIPTGTYPSSYNYRFAIDTALPGASVTVGTAAASPRIDYIVVYVDKTVTGSTANANVNNTNGVLKLADVQGTPAGSPSVPTVSQIQSTIGASNPYIILAQIAVGANVTTITNTNITDQRTFAYDRNDAALGANSYVDSGLVWSATTGLAASMTAGKAYINAGGAMVPITPAAISSYTFTASQDTYIYATINGVIGYLPVANGATPPTLPTNCIWLAKVVTGASTVSSVQNFATDAKSFWYEFLSGSSSRSSTSAQTWQTTPGAITWCNQGSVTKYLNVHLTVMGHMTDSTNVWRAALSVNGTKVGEDIYADGGTNWIIGNRTCRISVSPGSFVSLALLIKVDNSVGKFMEIANGSADSGSFAPTIMASVS